MTVLILHEEFTPDARPDELDALVQVQEVGQALGRLAIPVAVQSVGLDLEAAVAAVRRRRPTCVFNLVESLAGRGELIGVVPRQLAHARLPFTGSDGNALHLTSHKVAAKRRMATYGIATPDWFMPGERPGDDHERWIVKSLWEHASFGLDDSSVVTGRAAARAVMSQRARELGGRWFAERYVEGREFNVSLLERDGRPEVLPVAEMTFVGYPRSRPKIVGYAAKWIDSAPEYVATQRAFPELPPALDEAIRGTAQDCWRLFGLRGYARVDFRLDEHERPQVLEVNANPCLSRDAGFAAAAAEAGIAHDRLIERVLAAALPQETPLLKRAI